MLGNGTGVDKDSIPKLCKELINKHGGEIWVKSEVGKGNKFRFTIPFVQRGYSMFINHP